MTIRLDESDAPILVATFSESYTEAELRVFLEQVGRVLARRRNFGILFDLRQARVLVAAERKLFASFLRAHHDLLDAHCDGAALVTENALHRGVVTALSWMVKMPFEVESHARFEAAVIWLKTRL